MGLATTSLRTSCAARVRGRTLQRGRLTRTATKMTRVAKTEAMAGTGDARDGCDGRRQGMLDKSPDDLRSEGRGVKTTGGARARRGVLVSAGGYAGPPTMQTTSGAESSPVMDMPAGLSVASGAWRRRVGTWIAAVDARMPWGAAVNRMVLCSSARSAVSTDRVTDRPQQMASATVLVSERAR